MAWDKKVPYKSKEPLTALDNDKLHLLTPSAKEPGKNARLTVRFVKNSPWLKVWTADPEDKAKERASDYGSIYAKMDLIVWDMFIKTLRNMANSQALDVRDKISNLGYTWYNKVKSDTPVLMSETWVGKDKEGMVFISVIAKDRPRIKFIFDGRFHGFHNIVHGDGTDYTDQEKSVIHALSWVDTIDSIIKTMITTHFFDKDAEEIKPAPDGNNHFNSSSSSPNNSADDFENIPF